MNSHDQIQIYRYINQNERELLSVSFLTGKNTKLNDRDIVRVFNNFEIIEDTNIHIIGEVAFPGKYKFLKNMKMADLLLLAQPKIFASLNNIEVTRFNNKSTESFYVDYSNAKTFDLMPGDKISVKLDNLRDQTVEIELSGQFVFPGKYRVVRGTRLDEVIKMAGGYTKDAFLDGAVFTRKNVEMYDSFGHEKVIQDEKKRFIYDQSHLGSLSMDTQTSLAAVMNARQQSLQFLEEQVMVHSGRVIVDLTSKNFNKKNDNFIIEDQDLLHLPTTPESVHLIGGVQQGISIAYNSKYSLNDYVRNVGGFTKYADVRNVYVFKPSGRVFRNAKHIQAGDIVYVPEKVHISFNWLQFLTNVTAIISNAVTSVALIQSL